MAAKRIGAKIRCTLAARPSNPARRSIGWQARKTLIPGGSAIIQTPVMPTIPPQRLSLTRRSSNFWNLFRRISAGGALALGASTQFR